MVWFWLFVFYSFGGYLLEKAFAAATAAPQQVRKCFLLLPLCPVYGLGAVVILYLAPLTGGAPLPLFLLGVAGATVVEYATSLVYERGLGVSFWDYSGLWGNVRGRVCLPFSLAWGVLALALVWWVHPWLLPRLAAIPRPVSGAMLALLLADSGVSALMLRRTGRRECLQWYRPHPAP